MHLTFRFLILRKYYFCLVLFLSIFFASCDRAQNYPDTSDVEVTINFHRIDEYMQCQDSLQCLQAIEELHKEFPDFASLYLRRILPLGATEDSMTYMGTCAAFFSDSLVQTVATKVSEEFPDNDFLTASLKPVMQNWKYYFPNQPVPDFYSYYSFFNYGVVLLDDDAMGLGLDFFLGSDYPNYPPSRFPSYIKRTMDKSYLAARVAKGIIQNILPQPKSDRLLDYMIYEGKMLYLTKKLLPAAPDSLIFHYTQKKIDWMKRNELETWAALLKEEMLYSRDEVKFRKLISPSPSGPSFMPSESPGEAGSWIGWQIIKAYMARHPEVSLTTMINQMDSQQLLDKSRYKPQ